MPKNARACPHCGADERSGWNEDETRYDGLDLPDSDSGGTDANRKPKGRAVAILWIATAAVTILTLLYLLFH